MIIGVDIGYDSTKVVTREQKVGFKSVVGAYQPSIFSITGQYDVVLKDEAGQWVVGETALNQARFLKRREEADWYRSDDYRRLMLASFAQASRSKGLRLLVVTGLPVSYYQAGKEEVEALFSGTHRVELLDGPAQRIEVERCRVVPQPFGSAFALAMNDTGKIVDRHLAAGPTGVIDIGGKTTNLLQMSGFRDDSTRTTSINLGGWNLVRAIREQLKSDYPDLEAGDLELMEAIQNRQIWYYDRFIDLSQPVETLLAEMVGAIEASAGQLWQGGAHLRRLLITGGGANLLGVALLKRFRQAELVAESRFANASGYWKYGHFLAGHQ